MDKHKKNELRRLRRKRHIRKRVTGTSERPRLTIFKSSKHIYGQLIDDDDGKTLVAASTLVREVRDALAQSGVKSGGRGGAQIVGKVLAERARGAGITRIVFDRNGYKYHGRIKDLAEAARKGGLEF